MVRLIIIVALAFLGIFVHPFPPGVWDFILRFIVFVLIIYLLFNSQLTVSTKKDVIPLDLPDQEREKKLNLEEQVQHEYHLNDLLAYDERSIRYLIDQFEVIAGLAFPDHGWIFLKQNPDILKKIYHRNFSQSTVTTPQEEYKLSGLMQIVDEKSAILIENNLNQETQLVNLYDGIDYRPNSFMGLPVLIETEAPIFFVFDAAAKENFNVGDQPLFEKIRDNTAIFILNRLKAYSLLSTLKIKEKLMKLAIELNSSKTIAQAIEKFAQAIAIQFEASRLTISLCKSNTNIAVIRKVIGQGDEFGEQAEFPLDEGLTGWVISKKKPYVIENLEKGEYFIPRYSKNEKTNYGFRSFLGVPLMIEDRVYGALTLEHNLPYKYNTTTLNDIKTWVHVFSSTFGRQSSEATRPAAADI
jgi:transcriptional regulator with GAF, ATPase, and Fis domain